MVGFSPGFPSVISLSFRSMLMFGASAEYLGRAMVFVKAALTLRSFFGSHLTRSEGRMLM